MKPFSLLLPLLLLAAPPHPQTQETVADEPPSNLARTASQLRRFAFDDYETTVPPAVRPLLTTFKTEIRDLVGRELNAGLGTRLADGIQMGLKDALAREGVPITDFELRKNPYGWIDDLEVRRPAGLDRWVAVEVTQEIPCGSDSSLYMFEKRDDRWRLAFALEANGYDEISDALGSFDFGISPPDKQGGFFVVAVDINPWCVSNWQGIRYRAYRVTGAPLSPKPFLEETAGIFLNEPVFDLSVEADRLRVSFQGHQDLDTSILIRDYVRAYKVTGSKAERIGPLATEERGFIDEWIGLPWEVAARWAVPKARPSLRSWHDRLKAKLKDPNADVDTMIDTDFGALESCGPSRTQVTLELEEDPRPPALPLLLYFTVLRRGDDFRMERIDVAQQSGCAAPSPQQPP